MTDKNEPEYILKTSSDRHWFKITRQNNPKYPFVARMYEFSDGRLNCIDVAGVNLDVLPENAVRADGLGNILTGCPFCGSDNLTRGECERYENRHWIECRDCEARGPVKATLPEAVAAWNVTLEGIGNDR